jgi:hypothetical protein
MGDSGNLGSCLEDLNKLYGTHSISNEMTYHPRRKGPLPGHDRFL